MVIHQQVPAWQQAILDGCKRPGEPWVPVDKWAMMQQSISALFEEQVARAPERLAVKTDTVQLTYDELNRVANRLARSILAEQRDRTKPIAFCCTQRAHLVIGILGVLKVGGCFLILDHHSDPDRNTNILIDSAAEMLYTDAEVLDIEVDSKERLPHRLRLDQLDPILAGDNLEIALPLNTHARLVYTSGSTGQSKGIIQSQFHLIHATANLHNTTKLTADDRLMYSSADVFTAIIGPLLCGAAIFPIDLKAEGLSIIAKRITQDQITLFHTVPTVLQNFISTLNPHHTFPEPCVTILVGEPISRLHCEAFRTHFPHTTFLNFLGSKESLDYRVFALNSETSITDDYLPAGYALEDSEVLLVDPNGQPVGANEIGEIVVRSRYLAVGYLGKPELTQQKFIDAPTGSGERLYLTGDLGKMLPDGRLITLGRRDFRVKIRGYQVNIYEVEEKLAEIDGVASCAVVVNHDRMETPSLDAYMVLGQPTLTVTTIRALLAGSLPPYALPSRFIFLDRMPYGPGGKIIRSMLASAVTPRPEIDADMVLPRTPFEQTIAAIWAGVLGMDTIGVHDPFLDLGGNSLQAMRIAARVQEEFGVEIPLAELFAAATVAEMALVVTGALLDTSMNEVI